jgi:hypothetical protein
MLLSQGRKHWKNIRGNAETWVRQDLARHSRQIFNIKSKRGACAKKDAVGCEEHPRILYKHVQRHFDVPVSIRGIKYHLAPPLRLNFTFGFSHYSTMALFEVPGWTVPTDPILVSKKRKRPLHVDGANDKVPAAAINVEKLMKKLEATPSSANAKRDRTKKGRTGKGKPEDGTHKGSAPALLSTQREGTTNKQTAPAPAPAPAASGTSSKAAETKKKRNKKARKDADDEVNAAVHSVPVASKQQTQVPTGMTAMQAKMKQSLDGARFRCVITVSFHTFSDC